MRSQYQLQLRLSSAIDPTTGDVTLTNLGNSAQDISAWRFCNWPAYSTISSLGASASLAAGASEVINWSSAVDSDGELGLYMDASWASSSSVVDYVEWASTGHQRSSVAVAAGVWITGDFVDGPAPYTFNGASGDYGSAFWDVNNPTTATIEFVVDMNGVDQPSADYALVTVNGSWNGWTGFGAELFDADADGVYTGSLEIEAGTTFEYVVAVSGEADGYSGWGLQWGDGCGGANVVVTAGAAGSVTTTTLTPGCAEVLGCMDVNATNYDAAATEQAFNQYGNLSCIYASCDDIPDAEGCIYADSYASFYPGFGPVECVNYGGTACTITVLGCIDVNATNYDAAATEQAFDQYLNSSCIYASCEDIPEYGCIYVDGFGAFNATFGAADCVTYGGTPCEEPTTGVEGCLDVNATNYDAAATEQAFDQYGNFVCIYASCDDVPEYGCIYADGFGAFSSDALSLQHNA